MVVRETFRALVKWTCWSGSRQFCETGAEACNGAGLGPELHELLVSSHYDFTMLPAAAIPRHEAAGCLARPSINARGSVRDIHVSSAKSKGVHWYTEMTDCRVSTVHASKERYCGDDGASDLIATCERQRPRYQLVWVRSTLPLQIPHTNSSVGAVVRVTIGCAVAVFSAVVGFNSVRLCAPLVTSPLL